jgi:hypothetical protein
LAQRNAHVRSLRTRVLLAERDAEGCAEAVSKRVTIKHSILREVDAFAR